jgi:hypothetical protein
MVMQGKKWGERNYLFALLGSILVTLGLFAVKPEGIRSPPDTVALYLGLACLLVQVIIWLVAIARWIRQGSPDKA